MNGQPIAGAIDRRSGEGTVPEGSVRTVAPGSVRTTVVRDGVEADVSLPAGLAVAAVVPALLAVVRSSAGAAEPESIPATYELWTITGRRLVRSRSLWDNDVRDGDVLILAPSGSVTAPVVDDLAAAVALVPGGSDATRWPASVGPVGLVVAAAAAAATSVADHAALVVVGITVAVLTAAAAYLCATVTRDPLLVSSARGSACLLAFGAGVGAVPGHDLAADAVLGFAAVATVCVLTSAVAGDVGRATFTAITAVAVVGTVVGAVSAFTEFSTAHVAAVTATVCTIAVTRAPRLAASRAGIRIRPLPLGDAVSGTGRVAHRHTETTRAAAAATVDTDIDLVAARGATARSYLTGYGAALSVLAAASAVVTASAELGDATDPVRLGFAVLVAAVFCSQSRGHGDRTRALIAAVSGGCIVPAVCAVGVVVRPDLAAVWLAGTGAAAAVTIVCGLLAPRHEFTPTVRRAADWGEYAATGALIPVTVWIVGALSTVRGL